MPHILVVDDDPMVRTAMEIHLARHGFQVTIADGGEAGHFSPSRLLRSI